MGPRSLRVLAAGVGIVWLILALTLYYGVVSFNPQGNIGASFLVATGIVLAVLGYCRQIREAIDRLLGSSVKERNPRLGRR